MTWSKRYPWIVESALKNRYKQFVIDGEAVVLGVDGISDFNALHAGRQNDEVQLYAFDFLALDGDDLRHLPLSTRKAHVSRLFTRRPDGISIISFEQGESGPDLFCAACNMGLEGLVSKRRDQALIAADARRTGSKGEEPLAPRNGASEGRVLMIEKHSTLSQPSSSSFTMAMVVRSF